MADRGVAKMQYSEYKVPSECHEVAKALLGSQNVLIVPHINIDGDDLGSMVACAEVLKQLHKSCYLYSPDGTPEMFQFIEGTKDIKISLPAEAHFDTVLVLECPQLSRLPEGLDIAKVADKVINIDHHPINNLPADFTWIDASFCALGEMLYFLFKEMDVEPNRPIAEALYTSIVSDSGSFRYPSTSARTHLVAAHLLNILGDISYIHNAIFSSRTFADLRLQSLAMDTLRLHSQGRLVTASLTQEMLLECGLDEKDTQQLIAQLNVVRGSQIFALFKSTQPDRVRISLRSRKIPINNLAASHGGGGHALAAACSLEGVSLEEAYSIVLPELEALLP